MRIPVQYFDGTFDYVKPGRLEVLIRTRKIIGFRRADGWVQVPHGPIRGEGKKPYVGPERREEDE